MNDKKENKMICPNCHAEVEKSAMQICTACGHLIMESEEFAKFIEPDLKKLYAKEIWTTIAAVLLPILLTVIITASFYVAQYNNDINRQISEQHIQTQERIHQLEKQIVILEQKLGQAAEQTSN